MNQNQNRYYILGIGAIIGTLYLCKNRIYKCIRNTTRNFIKDILDHDEIHYSTHDTVKKVFNNLCNDSECINATTAFLDNIKEHDTFNGHMSDFINNRLRDNITMTLIQNNMIGMINTLLQNATFQQNMHSLCLSILHDDTAKQEAVLFVSSVLESDEIKDKLITFVGGDDLKQNLTNTLKHAIIHNVGDIEITDKVKDLIVDTLEADEVKDAITSTIQNTLKCMVFGSSSNYYG